MFRLICASTLAAIWTSAALADVPPPPPEDGFKRVPFEHVLKLGEKMPGYKFYTFQQLGLNGQETIEDELELKTDKGVVVPGNSSPSVRTGVVAVPAKVMAELKTTENLAKLLSRENKDRLPAGVVIHETHGTRRDLKESDPRDKVENVITVTPDDEHGVKFVEKTTRPKDGDGETDGTSAGLGTGTLIAGIAAALAVALFGIWIFRGKGA